MATASSFVEVHCCCSQEMPSERGNVRSRGMLVHPHLWWVLALWSCLMDLQQQQRQLLPERGVPEMEQSLGSSKQSFAEAAVSVVAVAVAVAVVVAAARGSGEWAGVQTLWQGLLVQTAAAGDGAPAAKRCLSLRRRVLSHCREPCHQGAVA